MRTAPLFIFSKYSTDIDPSRCPSRPADDRSHKSIDMGAKRLGPSICRCMIERFCTTNCVVDMGQKVTHLQVTLIIAACQPHDFLFQSGPIVAHSLICQKLIQLNLGITIQICSMQQEPKFNRWVAHRQVDRFLNTVLGDLAQFLLTPSIHIHDQPKFIPGTEIIVSRHSSNCRRM